MASFTAVKSRSIKTTARAGKFMDINPYSAPESIESIGARRPTSRVALASFVINILLALLMFTMIGLMSAGPRSPQRAMVAGMIGLLVLVLDVVAAGLGVIGLLQTGNARLLAAVGAISAVAVVGIAALFLLG
jgi:hypothetical protein